MARLLPDPTFYPSPSPAAEALAPLALGYALVIRGVLGAAAFVATLHGAGVMPLPFAPGEPRPTLDASTLHYPCVPVEVHSAQPGLTVVS